MNADGTEKKVLLSDGAFNDEARWSPDGKCIAYSQQWLGAGFRSRVYIMQSNGANPRPLVIVSNAGINQSQPVWVEDSRTLLFEAKDPDSFMCQFVIGNVSSDKGVLISEGECMGFFDLHIWHLPLSDVHYQCSPLHLSPAPHITTLPSSGPESRMVWSGVKTNERTC